MLIAAQAVKTAVYGRGDAFGKAKEAGLHALAQVPLQEPGSLRERIYQLQAEAANGVEVECPLQHVFAPGAYARTIFIPAGALVVGKIHKHQHLNILSKGDVSVVTEGGGLEHLQGPITMSSEPGTKRALYAHTDVVWTTIHLTNETDLAKIEKEVIAEDYAEYEAFVESCKRIGGTT